MSPTPAPDTNSVVPITQGASWADVTVRVAKARPRIPEADYWSVTTGLRKYAAFERTIVELTFDVFEGEYGSVTLARLPMFLALPPAGRPLAPNCRLAVMLRMVNQIGREQYRPVDLSVLRHKLWRVRVGTTKQSYDGKLEASEGGYSVVRKVLSRG